MSRKILDFLQTKIGIALLAAIVIIVLAAGLKYKNTQASKARSATGLLVEKIISESTRSADQLNQLGYQGSTSTISSNEVINAQPDVVYSPTDKFSQEIFKQYITAKQNGETIDPNISGKIAESVLAKDYNDSIQLYTAADMKISRDTSITALRAYGNSLAKILLTPPAAKESEIEIFSKITAGPVDGYIPELNAMKKRYKGMETKLLALSVPVALAPSQTSIANAINIFIQSIDGAISMETDPIGSLGKISHYQDGLSVLPLALESIKTYLRSQKVTFSTSESGYLFAR